jgi:hypothetical protein
MRKLEPPLDPELADDPVPTAGINYQRLYTYRFRDVDEASRQAVWQEIARYAYGRMGAPQRVLDPAAGRGQFITAVPAAERWGVDLVSQGIPDAAGVKTIIADIMDADLRRPRRAPHPRRGHRTSVRRRVRHHRGDAPVPAVFLPRLAAAVTAADQDLPPDTGTMATARQAIPGDRPQVSRRG